MARGVMGERWTAAVGQHQVRWMGVGPVFPFSPAPAQFGAEAGYQIGQGVGLIALRMSRMRGQIAQREEVSTPGAAWWSQ